MLMLSMFNPIVGIVHNHKLDTYHPIVFVEHPLPGNPEDLIRHKSKMHHTTGFPTRDEALANIDSELIPNLQTVAIGPVKKALAMDFRWDGNDIPIFTCFFAQQPDGTMEPSVIG